MIRIEYLVEGARMTAHTESWAEVLDAVGSAIKHGIFFVIEWG